jgi:hypothetical protein
MGQKWEVPGLNDKSANGCGIGGLGGGVRAKAVDIV